jgi:hypothetical protein
MLHAMWLGEITIRHRHDQGKNIIRTIRLQLCAKSFILQMYDVLAKHAALAYGSVSIFPSRTAVALSIPW